MWTGGVYDSTYIAVHQAANSCSGCQVYLNGSVTGQVLQTLVGLPYCAARVEGWVCGQQRTTPGVGPPFPSHCQDGDSGGPVFAFDGRGGVTAVGIHSLGSSAYCTYIQVPPILSRWSATITTSP
jgi:secreted trypsin-like serine protease